MTDERRDAIDLWARVLPQFQERRPLTATWAAQLQPDSLEGGVLRLIAASEKAAESMAIPRAIADLEELAGCLVLVEIER
jgi:hypothetical protein